MLSFIDFSTYSPSQCNSRLCVKSNVRMLFICRFKPPQAGPCMKHQLIYQNSSVANKFVNLKVTQLQLWFMLTKSEAFFYQPTVNIQFFNYSLQNPKVIRNSVLPRAHYQDTLNFFLNPNNKLQLYTDSIFSSQNTTPINNARNAIQSRICSPRNIYLIQLAASYSSTH